MSQPAQPATPWHPQCLADADTHHPVSLPDPSLPAPTPGPADVPTENLPLKARGSSFQPGAPSSTPLDKEETGKEDVIFF